MLTGNPPYTGGLAEVRHRIINDRSLTPPSNICPEITSEVDGAVLQALSRSKSSRYPDISRLGETLNTLRTDDHISKGKEYIPQEDSTWPLFQGDPTRSGLCNVSGPIGNVSSCWRYDVQNRIVHQPVLSDGSIFVGDSDGTVHAISVNTGEEHWIYDTSTGGSGFNHIVSSPGISNSQVYIGNANTRFFALNLESGNMEWVKDFRIVSSPLIADRSLYITTEDNRILSMNQTSGEIEWGVEIDRTGRSIAYHRNTVYVGSGYDALEPQSTGAIYAVNSKTGEVLWKQTTKRTISKLMFLNGGIFAGSTDSSVYRFDADNGDIQWQLETDDVVHSAPAITKGTVFVGSRDNHVYAIDCKKGEIQWQFETDGWIQSPIVTDGEIVYVGSMDNKVYALRATDGRLHWKYDTGAAVNQCIVITDQSLIVGNTDGELYAISDKNQ